MRLLVVDVNFDYKNPMYRQFYNHLAYCIDVDFYGPGYVSRELLERGIQCFIENRDGYDAVLVGTYFWYAAVQGLRYDTYSLHRNLIPYYNINDAWQCCRSIGAELLRLNNIIKIFAFYEDSVMMSEAEYKECKKLLAHDFFILSYPHEYMGRYSGRKMRQYSYLTNNAPRLAEEYRERYIPIPWHGISYEELFFRNYKDREYDWCIPGNRNPVYYPERTAAYQRLKNSGVKMWEKDSYQKLSVGTVEWQHLGWYQFRNLSEKALSALIGKDRYISSYPKLEVIAACREQYRESMRRCKAVYAEGGTGDCFVRKYFETCAMGAMLVAKRVPGMDEMGFRNGKNCIIIEKYEDLKWVNNRYRDEDENAAIAKAGQKLILDKHMFVQRANALAETIMAIKAKHYNGAVWRDGNYMIQREKAI